jgi:hypothetical protein
LPEFYRTWAFFSGVGYIRILVNILPRSIGDLLGGLFDRSMKRVARSPRRNAYPFRGTVEAAEKGRISGRERPRTAFRG